MKQIMQKLEENYLFGCIKYGEKYNIYLMPIAWWILNYQKYDPASASDSLISQFRNNVINVTSSKLDDFIKAIDVDKVDLNVLTSSIRDFPRKYLQLYFFVDLDKKTYVNSFPDIELEEYLPDENWTGIFGSPMVYLPQEIKEIFK